MKIIGLKTAEGIKAKDSTNLGVVIRAWDETRNRIIPPRNIIGLEGNLTEKIPYKLIPQISSGKKDKNDKTIFQGDIVKSGITGAVYIIMFGPYRTKTENGVGFWKLGLNVENRNIEQDSNSMYIIGHIYEHNIEGLEIPDFVFKHANNV